MVKEGSGCIYGETVPDAVARLFPTPTAIEGVKWTNTWNPDSQMGQSLSEMAGSGMIPTPRANQVNDCDLNNPKLAERNKSNLEEVVAKAVVNGLLPTPQMQDYNTGISQEAKVAKLERYKDKGVIPSGTYMLRQMAIEGKLPKPDGMDVPETDGGNTSRLSPLFVADMMGFPVMWCDI